MEQPATAAKLLQATQQRNDAAASLRKTGAGDLLDLRLALREVDSRPSIGQAGASVVRALSLLLGESIAEIIPHHVQMPRLVERLLGAEMETASLSWSTEVLDVAEQVLDRGALTVFCTVNGGNPLWKCDPLPMSCT